MQAGWERHGENEGGAAGMAVNQTLQRLNPIFTDSETKMPLLFVGHGSPMRTHVHDVMLNLRRQTSINLCV
jgi:hypothetical protein